jgi:hypothetical protein
MQNTGFEITFDISDTGNKIGDLACSADKCLFVAYLEPGELIGSGSDQSESSLILPISELTLSSFPNPPRTK